MYFFNPDQCAVLHQGPLSASVINMWLSLYRPRLQINQRLGHWRKGANISSITPERHHGEMQIASLETLGDVKKKLAGRQQEANEYNGKCIQGQGGNTLLYSYQLMQSYQWRCAVEGGPMSTPCPYPPPPHSHTHTFTLHVSVLFKTGLAGVISLVGAWARPVELRRF